jgi:calcineurin-like phosphoesterase family protein
MSKLQRSRSFICSDLHINHIKCALEWRGFKTVEEHNEFIIDNYNSTVKNKDAKVYILGDVVFQPATSLHMIDRLYGKKILIAGNHDEKLQRYIPYFEGIYSYFGTDGGLFMSHVPIHNVQLDERFTDNLHGHIHQNTIGIDDGRYLNVNVEFHDYKPINLFDTIELLKLKKEGKYNEYRKV